MEFADYLREECRLGESSVKDYLGRWRSIENRGLYNGETELTPSLEAVINKEFKGDTHYSLTFKRYIDFINKNK